MVRDVEVAGLNFLEQGGDEIVIKGEAADQKNIENDAAAPDVDFGTSIQLAGDDLGCSIVGTTTARLQKVSVRHDVTEAKVGNFDVVVLVQEQILWLEITMDNLVAMTVLYRADDLLEHLPGFLLVQTTMLDDVVKQLHWGILQDHDDVLLVHDDGVELDDVWMSQELQVLNFPFHSSRHVATDQLPSRNDLHGDLLTRYLVTGQFDLAERAFSELANLFVLGETVHRSEGVGRGGHGALNGAHGR